MRNGRRALLALAAFAALAGAAPSRAETAAGPPPDTLLDRAFTVVAEAYPVEPAPGSQSQPIAIRPAASRISLANPPATAYARAAAADLGLAESYFGQQGPSAEVDTAVAGQPHEEAVDDDGTRLRAVVTETPSAESSAEIVTADTGVTASDAAGTLTEDGRLEATASAELRDATIGPLEIAGARFEAEAGTTGMPGGGAGSGSITVSGATAGGVPVVVDESGIRVAETEVPLGQVGAASTALQELLAQGGYSDVRVIQPKVVVQDDGRLVEVSGGGIALYLTNNDPSNRYFVSLRALGGRVLVAVGDDIGTTVTADPVTPAETSSDPPAGDDGPAAILPLPSPSPPPTASAPAHDGAVELAYVDAGARTELRGIWTGWPWVLLGAAATVAAALVALRTTRGRLAADRLLDGYLRG